MLLMGELVPDILEQILINLGVKDLMRYKSVCKSWKSLISSSDFIESHLNQSCKNYHNNEVPKRLLLSRFGYRSKFSCEVNNMTFDFNKCLVIGFCNGLLCISPTVSDVLVTNPSTREVRKVRKSGILDSKLSCWGFGYDSLTKDYKVVLGFERGKNRTCFQVLTLKSNVWNVVGDAEYSSVSSVGTLCNGALHWFMKDENDEKVILSFDLSKEEFKEIPQPDDWKYEFTYSSDLEIFEECLCIFRDCRCLYNMWLLKNYDVKQSWELKTCYLSGCIDPAKCPYRTLKGVGSPIYMESLVSPIVNEKPKRKRQAMTSKKNDKVIKREPFVPEPSPKV